MAVAIVFMLTIVVIAMPTVVIGLPLSALFFLPIYLPFLLSFFIGAHEWRGMRWALRVSSILAVFVGLSGMSGRPDFGDDVAGNIAGASHNFAWTWGSGLSCAFVAVIAGLLLRVVLPSRSRVSSEDISHE